MRFILYITIFLLVSCSAGSQSHSVEPLVMPKPTPIQVANVHWHVKNGDVCLSSTDGIKLNVQRKDTIRYIKDLKTRLCLMGDKQYCEDK